MTSRTLCEDDERRSWQLVMTGDLPDPLSPDLVADLTRLLDLRPDLACLDLETDAGGVHVARDWPSDRMEEADMLLARIEGAAGVRGLTLHLRKTPPSPSSSCFSPDNARSSPPSCATMPIASSPVASTRRETV